MNENSGASAAADDDGWSWDPLVRLTHWGVAAAVLANGIVTEEGSSIHVWIGYGAFALLALRLLWGFVGTAPARFSAFPISLSAARAHVGDLLAGRRRRHGSHNPLGALMVYALWGSLAVVIATGVAMAGSPLTYQPEDHDRPAIAGAASTAKADDHERREAHEREHDDEDEEGEEILEEIHGVFANLMLILAALHVGGVLLESRLSGENLARAMVTGAKRRGPEA